MKQLLSALVFGIIVLVLFSKVAPDPSGPPVVERVAQDLVALVRFP